MGSEELFPIVNEDDEVIGQAPRTVVHSKGLIHRSVFFFLFDKQGKVFVNQRTEEKEFYPGYWSIVFGGHVRAGETYGEAVKRELIEEAGIDKAPFFISSYKKRFDNNDKENVKVFGFVVDSQPILDKREIKQGVFMSMKELQKKIKEENFLPETQYMYEILRALKPKNLP